MTESKRTSRNERAQSFFGSRCSTTRARDDGWARFYPRAIAQVLGTDVQHRVSDCLTNRIEQDHRGIKQLLSDAWFGAFESAKRYRQAFDEVRNFPSSQPMRESVSLSEKRQLFVNRYNSCNLSSRLLKKGYFWQEC